MLKATTSGDRTRRDEVIKRNRVKGTESTSWTLNSLVDRLCQRVYGIWIIVGSPSVLDIVTMLELLEALHTSIVDILGIRDELRRRRRSVGGRHFK